VKLLGLNPAFPVCAALISAAFLIAGCTTDSSTVTTSTVTVTKDPSNPSTPTTSANAETERDFAVGDFTAVHLAAHYELVVTVGSPTSVRAQGDPAALDLLDIRTEGDTLVATVKPNVQWPPNARVTVTVTTPSLTAAELSGSGSMRIGSVHADTLSLDQNGSGAIEAPELTVTKLSVSSSGSGKVRAGGAADDADIRLSGSGKAELTALAAKRADVSVSGSGSLAIEASEKVSGSISGSGSVQVTGGAACSISTTGSGKATCG
jgi:putative autotransporter adhesin-like protein